jgi:hypothetical protein
MANDARLQTKVPTGRHRNGAINQAEDRPQHSGRRMIQRLLEVRSLAKSPKPARAACATHPIFDLLRSRSFRNTELGGKPAHILCDLNRAEVRHIGFISRGISGQHIVTGKVVAVESAWILSIC